MNTHKEQIDNNTCIILYEVLKQIRRFQDNLPQLFDKLIFIRIWKQIRLLIRTEQMFGFIFLISITINNVV